MAKGKDRGCNAFIVIQADECADYGKEHAQCVESNKFNCYYDKKKGCMNMEDVECKVFKGDACTATDHCHLVQINKKKSRCEPKPISCDGDANTCGDVNGCVWDGSSCSDLDLLCSN